ncbi:MAG: UDP-N-acetylmuramoyl-tripeptide--D-alanyl-D-alanine ligase [bacterium]
MKSFIAKILKFFAKRAIKKNNPIVIGITGSVGKTGAKHTVSYILDKFFFTGGSIKNYNNEIGYPLSILGIDSASKSVLAWAKILFLAFKKAYFNSDFPEVLVLELAARKPGDIDYLGEIAEFDAVIITAIGPSHIEKFGSIKQIAKEKFSIAKHLKKNGKLIYNFDDEIVREAAKTVKADCISYGFNKGADFQAVSGKDINLNFDENGNFIGSGFKVERAGSFMPIRLVNVISKAQAYSVLAGLVVSDVFNINLVEAVERLKDLPAFPGRMSLISGIEETLIIDDSYNASPASMEMALESLGEFKNRRRIAALGDMLELGSFSEKYHRQVGKAAAKTANLLFLVGGEVLFLKKEALAAGMKENRIKHFSSSAEAAKAIKDEIKKGDVVLVKGSQSMRMEKIVEAIMADSEKAEELLVRQEKEWKKSN